MLQRSTYATLFKTTSALPSTNAQEYKCLSHNDVISARVSDHHPVVHHQTLFWNIQKQGNHSLKNGFNNGIGLIENEQHYLDRLKKIAAVVAEIAANNPEIEVLSFCEGPVVGNHVKLFQDELKKYPSLQKFNELAQVTNHGKDNWGLLMMVKANLKVKKEPMRAQQLLGNRFQLWKLTKGTVDKYFALSHLPYGEGNENAESRDLLSPRCLEYYRFIEELLTQYQNKELVVASDFNFNPNLLLKSCRFDQIPVNNSVLLNVKNEVGFRKAVTVDGILLSKMAKQKAFNFTQQSLKCLLWKPSVKYLEKHRHHNAAIQVLYDKQRGLIPYKKQHP
jgi:hypothetical protein